MYIIIAIINFTSAIIIITISIDNYTTDHSNQYCMHCKARAKTNEHLWLSKGIIFMRKLFVLNTYLLVKLIFKLSLLLLPDL